MPTKLTLTISAKDQATGTVQGLEQAFEGSFDDIRSDLKALNATFKDVGNDIVDTFKEVSDKIKDAGRGAEGIPGIGGRGFGPIASGLLSGLGSVVKIVFRIGQTVVSTLIGALAGLTNIVVGAFKAAFDAATSIVSSILSGIKTVIGAAFEGLSFILDRVVLLPFKIVFNKITALAAGVGIGWGTKLAADFHDSLSIAFALIPQKMTPILRTGLQRSMEDLRAATGAGGVAIGRTLYNAISAGAKDAPKPLTEAAIKFSVLGGQVEAADMALALFAQTANTLKKPLTDATDIAEMYQKTIQEGILLPADLAMQMGRVLPFVESLKLDFKELLGIIAQASKTFRPEQLFTGLSGVLSRILDPEAVKAIRKELKIDIYERIIDQKSINIAKKRFAEVQRLRKEAEKWGVEDKEILADLARAEKSAAIELEAAMMGTQGAFIGLANMLEALSRAEIPDETLKKIFPDIRSKKFFLGLREDMAGMRATIEEIQKYPGAITTAWEERSRSASLAFQKLMGSIANVFSTVFGLLQEGIVDVFGGFQEKIDDVVAALRNFADSEQWPKLKNAAKDVLETIKGWIPSWQEVQKALKDVAIVGVTAFKILEMEVLIVWEAIRNLFYGKEADLSKSLLILSFQIGLEYLKLGAAKAVTAIREYFNNLITSDTSKAVLDKFVALGDLLAIKARIIGRKMLSSIGVGLAEKSVITYEKITDILGEPDPIIKKLLLAIFPSKEDVDRNFDVIRTAIDYDYAILEKDLIEKSKAMERLEAPIPFTLIPELKIETGTLEELQRQFLAEFSKRKAISIEEATYDVTDISRNIGDAINKALGPIMESMKGVTEEPPVEVEKISSSAAAVKERVRSTLEKIRSMEGYIRDMAYQQMLFAEEHGRLSQQIIDRVRQLVSEIHAERQKIYSLQSALKAL